MGGWGQSVDVLVVGGGMGGPTAAVAALEAAESQGAPRPRVLVAEKGHIPGGNMALASGNVSVYPSYEAIRAAVPRGDPRLQRALVDGVRPGWAWLEGHGVPITPEITMPNGWLLRAFDPRRFAEIAVAYVQARGGVVRQQMEVVELAPDREGWRVGLRAADGSTEARRARSVVLATGGFQNNPDLLRQYLGLDPTLLLERNSGLSDGAGLRLATGVGASLSDGMSTFYGHDMPAPAPTVAPEDLAVVSQNYGGQAIALNLAGERFGDESEGELDETLAQDVARQPGARAVYVFDHAVYQQFVATSPSSGFPAGKHRPDKLAAAREVGGEACSADSLESLAEVAQQQWGVPAETMLRTLREYDAAARAGRASDLAQPKRRWAHPLAEAPFYAVLVAPGLTSTMGGLRCDDHGRVLRADGAPLPGLFAAGVDVGNVNHRRYAGGLALGLVFGRLAGGEAARHAGPRVVAR